MDQSEIVMQFVDRIDRGEITFDQVRKELAARNTDEQEIRSVVRQVDEEVLRRLASKSERWGYTRLMRVGYVLTVLGAILVVVSLLRYFKSLSGYLALLIYGPLFLGLSLIFAAWKGKARSEARIPDRSDYRKPDQDRN